MFEEARSVKGMIEMCGMTQSEMAKKLGVSQSYVANKLRLLSLGSDEQERIIAEGLSERHARALLRLRDPEERGRVLGKVCSGKLTVRETEALVDLCYDTGVPKLIGGGDGAEGVELFLKTLRSSVNTLRSLGVEARESVFYSGRRLCITVSIDE